MTDEIRNVVLVIVDALRRDRVGCYDSDLELTPNVDSLAEEGTVFESAFACTNATDPSVTSIHTGRDPETVVKHHGPFVTEREKRRAETVPTVPEALRDAGYHTVVTGRTLGRWHANGFDHYPVPTLDRYKRRRIGQALGAISPRLRSLAGRTYEWVTSTVDSESRDEVDEFLDSIDDDPFYGMIHMMDTHVPYSHDEERVERFLREHDYPNQDFATFLDEHGDGEYVGDFMTDYADEADFRDGLARWFAKYDAAVVEADRKIGALVDGLRERGRLDETAIVVTSDHGESLDEHGIFFDHHGLYEPQIRVPLVVRGPGVPADRRDELLQLYDLAPTTLALLDVETDLDCDGRNLAPLLGRDGSWDEREQVVVQEAHAQRRIGIRTREHKLIKHVEDDVLERERGDSFRCGYCNTVHGAERELYDLASDPDETENVVDSETDVAAELDGELTAYFDGLRYPDAEGEDVDYEGEEEVLDRLEDLGYV